MKETIKKLQKKMEELIEKVPDKEYINVNSVKSLAAAILDLRLAEKAKAEADSLNK